MSAHANKAGQGAKATRPWGQKILREKSIEIFREGKVAPSALMANLLAASASPVLDTDTLSAAPRAMSSEANRVISVALQKSRMPHADLEAIFDELISLTWVAKASSAQAEAQRSPPSTSHKASGKPRPAGKAAAPVAKAPAVPAPIIVRRHAKLPTGH